MRHARKFLGLAALWLAGCATTPAPNEPAAMVPASLAARVPADVDVFVEKVTADSAAKDGRAPFDHLTGAFPLAQPQGLDNYRESVRLTLQAAGTRTGTVRAPGAYVLRTSVLGGMAIPYADAYSVLFVHYQLEDGRSGSVLWSKTVYSQAKLENRRNQPANDPAPNPAYGRLAAANLRQMAEALSAWFAAPDRRREMAK